MSFVLSVLSSVSFQVGRTPLGKGDVIYFCAPNQDLARFHKNVMTVVGLFTHVSGNVKSDVIPHQHGPNDADFLMFWVKVLLNNM